MEEHFPEIKTKLKAIPKTMEKFMSLTLEITMAKEVHQKQSGGKKVKKDFIFKIHFRDSFSFLQKSLDDVMKKFPEKNLKILRLLFLDEKDFQLLRKKGIFPYGDMNDRSKFTASLSKQCECFDVLSNKRMDDESYDKMVKAYNVQIIIMINSVRHRHRK